MAAAALAALALMTAGCGTQVSAQTDTVPAASAETAADTMTLDAAEAASSEWSADNGTSDAASAASTATGICTLCRKQCPLSAPKCDKPYAAGLL